MDKSVEKRLEELSDEADVEDFDDLELVLMVIEKHYKIRLPVLQNEHGQPFLERSFGPPVSKSRN